MDTLRLVCFKMIAESGSLTTAAQQLHVTQPALSRTLRRLEEDLGLPLFDRSGNRIHLNSHGETALLHVNRILYEVDAFKEEMTLLANQRKMLSISFCDPGIRWFCTPDFSLGHPDTQLFQAPYSLEDPLGPLLRRECDLLVTPVPCADPEIVSVPFLQDTVCLSVPPDSAFAERPSISMTDLSGSSLFLMDVDGCLIQTIKVLAGLMDDPIRLSFEKNSVMYGYRLNRESLLTTSSILAREFRSNDVGRVLIPFSDPELTIRCSILYLRENHAKVRVFLRWAGELIKARGNQKKRQTII